MSEFNKYPPEVQQQRDALAQEIKSIRSESSDKKKESKSLKSRVTGKSERLIQEAVELKENAKDRLQKGKEAIDLALEKSRLGLQDLESVSTDHNLIRWYYKHLRRQEVHPVATDTFIDKSRDEYNAAWLSRELVQNFIDHNPKAPGTLNGVSLNREELPNGKIRFTITGEWPFPDPTGIISPHSEKPADTHTAGGNGIGLKQTAIRYLRDFGVSKFEIDGESWVANYQLANAAGINKEIEQAFKKAKEPVTRSMRHDWLVADLKTNGSHGRCSYIIETDNAEVIQALGEFENLGVCDKNEYLQNPDFSNKQGAIKWLPPRTGQQEGRLFINGQVMNYGSKGKTSKDYWVGPEYVTVQLNDIAYKMSVDRPPVQSYELGMYMSHLVGSMTVEQIMDQIKQSEPIWTIKDISERTGAMVLVDKLIGGLKYNSKYDKKQYAQHFGDKKYLARDQRLSDAQVEDLQKQGHTLCPASFEYIGMPKASSKLSNLEMAASQKPDTYRANSGLEKIAEESGIPVAYEDFDNLKPEQLFATIQRKIAENNFEVVGNPDRPNVVRIRLNIDIPKELLSRALPKPRTDAQKTLHFFRGVAFAGLDKSILKRIYLAQGEYVTTFGTQYDSALEEDTLFARNLKATTDQGVFVEMELEDDYLHLKDVLIQQERKLEPASVAVEQTTKSPEVSKAVEVKQAEPPKPEQKKNIPVIIKEREQVLSEAQLDELDGLIPGIKGAIQKLQEVADKTKTGETAGEKGRMEKYKEWRDSAEANKLAEESAGYVTGRTIGEIVSAYNEAEIATVKEVGAGSEEEKALSELADLKKTLQSAINKMNPDGEVQDFEMVFDPKPRQLAQLGLLRIYAYLTTGVAIKNKLFAFRGTGVTGINMQREAIGLHEKELDQSFLEAAGIFTHELAHNEHMDHDVGFMTTMEALFLETQRKLTEIALKAKRGEELNENEDLILSVVEKWDELRNQG